MATDSVSAAIIRYTVTIRAVGGSARAAQLVIAVDRPASWMHPAPGCIRNAAANILACPLGDLSGARTLTMTVAANGMRTVEVAANVSAAKIHSHDLAIVTVIAPLARSTRPKPRRPRVGACSGSSRSVAGTSASGSSAAVQAPVPAAADHSAPTGLGAVPIPVAASAPVASPGQVTKIVPPIASPNAVLPNVAAPTPSTGVPAMAMFTPERALTGDQKSQVAVVALAIVAGTALLWLSAAILMWRRDLVHLRKVSVRKHVAGNVEPPRSSSRRLPPRIPT